MTLPKKKDMVRAKKLNLVLLRSLENSSARRESQGVQTNDLTDNGRHTKYARHSIANSKFTPSNKSPASPSVINQDAKRSRNDNSAISGLKQGPFLDSKYARHSVNRVE